MGTRQFFVSNFNGFYRLRDMSKTDTNQGCDSKT